MAVSFPCPRCGQRYSFQDAMAGARVRCKACGQPFEVPAAGSGSSPSVAGPAPPATAPAPPVAKPAGSPFAPAGVIVWEPDAPATPGSRLAPAATPGSGSLGELLEDALGPGPGDLSRLPGDADFGSPFGPAGLVYRRRRTSVADKVILAMGIVLAGLGLLGLLVLFRPLKITGLGWIVTAMVFGVLGAGLVVWGQRRNYLVALPVGTAICCLVVVGYVIRPLPKTPRQLAEDFLRLLRETVTEAESIHDAESLRAARPKVLDLFRKMFRAADRLDESQARGEELSPEMAREVETASRELYPRSRAVGQRLRDIPGGTELAQEIALITEEARARAAARRAAGVASKRGPQEPVSEQRRQELPSQPGTAPAPGTGAGGTPFFPGMAAQAPNPRGSGFDVSPPPPSPSAPTPSSPAGPTPGGDSFAGAVRHSRTEIGNGRRTRRG